MIVASRSVAMHDDPDRLRRNARKVIAESHDLIRSFRQLCAERQLNALEADARRIERKILSLLKRVGIGGLER